MTFGDHGKIMNFLDRMISCLSVRITDDEVHDCWYMPDEITNL